MGVLSRHFISRFLSAFAAALLILVLSIGIVEMLADLDAMFGPGTSFRDAIRILALRIPARDLPFLIPVGGFAAAFLCFGNAARSLEVVASKAGGISPFHLLLPVFAVGALLSALSLVLNETVSVRAHGALVRIESGGAQGLSFRQGYFWYRQGRFLYRVEEADPERRILRGVTIYERDTDGRLLRRVVADRAEMADPDRWRLAGARSEHFDPDDPAAPLRVDIRERDELRVGSERALLEASLRALSILNLMEYRSLRTESSPDSVRALALIHERLVSPITTLLFVMLAAALGLRVERIRSLAKAALYGLIALFVFFLARRYAGLLGGQGVLPPALAAWSIVGLFTAFTLDQLRRIPR